MSAKKNNSDTIRKTVAVAGLRPKKLFRYDMRNSGYIYWRYTTIERKAEQDATYSTLSPVRYP